MGEQTHKLIQEFLWSLLKGAERGEIPPILQERLRWDLAEASIYAGFWLILLIGCAVTGWRLYRATRGYRAAVLQGQELSRGDRERQSFLQISTVVCIGGTIVFGACALDDLVQALYIYTAPRVYVIAILRQMV